jgi:hypothetical protein
MPDCCGTHATREETGERVQIMQLYSIDLHAFGRAGSKLPVAGYLLPGFLQVKFLNPQKHTRYCGATTKPALHMVVRHEKCLLARVSGRGFFVATLSHIHEFPCDRAFEQHCATYAPRCL